MKRYVLLFAFAAGILVSILYVNRIQQGILPTVADTASAESLDIVKMRGAIDTRIRAIGGAKTYQEIKTTYGTKHFSVQHKVAHLFGELLYQREGIEGIGVCDGNFAFGCYHGFFGKAVAGGGVSMVRKLDEACVKRFGPLGLGCPHGIGHGLGEYFGPTRLDQQLEACAGLSWQGPLFGCQEGVFMEYNFPTIVDEKTVSKGKRPFEPVKPYEPCTQVSERFRRACYFEMGTFWELIFQKDYTKIGSLCAGIANESEKNDCFKGIGHAAAATSGFDVGATRQACDRMPTIYNSMLCLAGASWSLFAQYQDTYQMDALCTYVPEQLHNMCKTEANLLQY